MSQPGTNQPTSRYLGSGLLAVAIVSATYILIAPFFLGHFDLGWHLAAGDLIRSLGRVPTHDPWSFTAGEQPWFNLSWLWDVAQSLLLEWGGFTAIILETLAVGALVAAILFATCAARGTSPLAAGIATFFVCVLYPTFAAPDLFLGATPGAVTVLFTAAFTAACLRPRLLWVTPLCMMLWVNMHGGFVVGPCLLAAFAGCALLRRERAAVVRFVVFLLLNLAATLVNPLGPGVYAGMRRTVGHFAIDQITEWQPYFHVIGYPQCVPFCGFALLFILFEIAGRRARPVEPRLLAWCFLIAGMWKLRYLSMFLILSALPMAVHLDALLPSVTRRPPDERRLRLAGLAAGCCLPLLYLWTVPPHPGFLPQTYPEAEIDWLAAHLPHERVLAHWNYGGFTIFRTRGNVKLFIDGRAATAYPDEVLHDYFSINTPAVDPQAWAHVLAKYRIDAVMWPKAQTKLANFLVDGNGWRLAFSGRIANIYVRGR